MQLLVVLHAMPKELLKWLCGRGVVMRTRSGPVERRLVIRT